jgi:DNA-binding transcriptional regulator YiaG
MGASHDEIPTPEGQLWVETQRLHRLANEGADAEGPRLPEPGEIRGLRKALGLSLTEAAALLRTTRRGYAFWEAGTHQMPKAAWELFCIKSLGGSWGELSYQAGFKAFGAGKKRDEVARPAHVGRWQRGWDDAQDDELNGSIDWEEIKESLKNHPPPARKG